MSKLTVNNEGDYNYAHGGTDLRIEWARPSHRKGQVALTTPTTGRYNWIAAEDVNAVCDAIRSLSLRTAPVGDTGGEEIEEVDAIKVGDTVTSRGDGGKIEVIGVRGSSLWLETPSGTRFTALASGYKKVHPEFEAGKTYTCCGDTFHVTEVQMNSDGTRVAFGKLANPSGESVWVTKHPNVRHVWTEK